MDSKEKEHSNSPMTNTEKINENGEISTDVSFIIFNN